MRKLHYIIYVYIINNVKNKSLQYIHEQNIVTRFGIAVNHLAENNNKIQMNVRYESININERNKIILIKKKM